MSVNLRKVDLNLLNIFSELIKDPHITNTAKRMNMTQPAVSMALQRLRSLYDDALFIREGKTMKPTARALEVAPAINSALALIGNTLPNNQSFNASNDAVNFKMNIFSYAEQLLAADLVAKLQESSPSSTLFITSEYITEPEKLLRDRRIDIHVDYKPIIHPDFNFHEINREELVIIAKPDHPRLKNKKVLSMADFFREKHAVALAPNGTEFICENFIKDFSKITKDRQVGYHGPSTLGVLSMVARSDMITLAPKHLIQALNNYSEFLEFTPPFPCNEFITYLNWYVGIQYEPSHRWFRDFVIKNSQEYCV